MRNGPSPWRAGSAAVPSASTAATFPARTRPSAGTSSRVSAGSWAWPGWRSSWSARPSPRWPPGYINAADSRSAKTVSYPHDVVSAESVAVVSEQGAVPLTPAKARIIAAASGLFAEHGVGGTSLQMIADAIGVTKAAVYHQFKAKDE